MYEAIFDYFVPVIQCHVMSFVCKSEKETYLRNEHSRFLRTTMSTRLALEVFAKKTNKNAFQ